MNDRSRSGSGGIAGALVGALLIAVPLAGCVGGGRIITTGTGAGGDGDPTGGAGTGPTPVGTGGTGIVEPPVGGRTTEGTGGGGGIPVTMGTGGTTGSPGGRSGASCSVATGPTPTMTTATRGVPFPPTLGTMVTAAIAPPAVSGGTLRVLADGQTAVAADPDRDRAYVVDLSARAVIATVMFQAGDEPGRVIEDAAGRVHVALRHGGAIASFDPRQQ
jgi:hypothetical protein